MSKADFQTWLIQPATKQVFAALRELRQEWADKLANGGTLCGNGPTEQETARAVGVIQGIDFMLQAKWE